MRPLLAALALAPALSACEVFSLDRVGETGERPLVSRSARTAADGTVEVELGARVDPGERLDLPSRLRLGVDHRSEVFVDLPLFELEERPGEDADGLGDLRVGVRRRVLGRVAEEGALALSFAAKVPTGDEEEGLSTGDVDFALASAFTREVGPVRATAFYRLGILGEPGSSSNDLQHDVALAGALTLPSRFELYGEAAFLRAHERDFELLLSQWGARWRWHPAFALDLGVAVGWLEDGEGAALTVGLVRNLGGLFELRAIGL